MKRSLMFAGVAGLALLGACQMLPADEPADAAAAEETIEEEVGVLVAEATREADRTAEAEMSETAESSDEEMDTSAADALATALDMQPDEVKARYEWRHPGETLEFFEIEPGMTVIEALPGGGWYSKILIPYLRKAP